MKSLHLTGALMLAACSQQTQPEGNAAVANIGEQAAEKCAPPTLALPDGDRLQSSLLNEATANFRSAFGRACNKGLLADKPLIDPKAADKERLFLLNAPEANVASIYLSSIDGNRMLLEYPFLTTDGKTQVPSAAELEEAIYCAVVGATPEEQESTGRCLVD